MTRRAPFFVIPWVMRVPERSDFFSPKTITEPLPFFDPSAASALFDACLRVTAPAGVASANSSAATSVSAQANRTRVEERWAMQSRQKTVERGFLLHRRRYPER